MEMGKFLSDVNFDIKLKKKFPHLNFEPQISFMSEKWPCFVLLQNACFLISFGKWKPKYLQKGVQLVQLLFGSSRLTKQEKTHFML